MKKDSPAPNAYLRSHQASHLAMQHMLKWVVIFFLIIIACFSGLFLRLRQGPIDLTFAEKTVEKLAASEHFALDIEGAQLKLLDKSAFTPSLQLEKLSITEKEGKLVFSDVDFHLRLRSLLALKLRPRLAMAKTVSFEGQFEDDKASENTLNLQEIYNTKFSTGIFSSLEKIIILKASLKTHINHDMLGDIEVQNAKIRLTHDKKEKSLRLNASGLVSTKYFSKNADFETIYSDATGNLAVGLDLKDLETSLIENPFGFEGRADIKFRFEQNDKTDFQKTTLNIISKNSRVSGYDIEHMDVTAEYLPATRKAILHINALQSAIGTFEGIVLARRISENIINLAVTGKANKVNFDNFFADPVDFETVHMLADLQQDHSSLDIKKLDISTSGVTLAGTAKIVEQVNKNHFALETKLSAEGITQDNLISLWPVAVPGNARSWIKKNGNAIVLKDTQINLTYDTDWDMPDIDITSSFHNGDFYFRKPMSPIKQASGKLSLKNEALSFDIQEAVIEDIQITQGKFSIADVHADKPVGDIEIDLNGRVKTLSILLDQEPLKLLKSNGFDVPEKNGQFTGQLAMSIPLLSNVRFEDITLKGDIDVVDAAFSIGDKMLMVTNFKGPVSLTEKSLRTEYRAILEGHKVTGKLTETFSHAAPLNSEIYMKGGLDEKILDKLGIDLLGSLSGKMQTDIFIGLKRGDLARLKGTIDATKASLKIPESDYIDPVGAKKIITLNGQKEGNVFAINDLKLKSKRTNLHIDKLLAGRDLNYLSVAAFNAENIFSNLTATYKKDSPEKRAIIKAKASKVNLERFIDYEDTVLIKDNQPMKSWPYMSVKLYADQMRLDEDKTLSKVAFDLRTPSRNSNKITGEGVIGKSGRIKIAFEKQNPRISQFAFTAMDAGAFLKEFDAFDHFTNGKLELKGSLSKDNKNISTTRGRLDITDGRLKNAPTVAKFFSLASMTGIVDRLQSEDIAMDKIEAEFTKRTNKINLQNGIVRGSAIGITFQGDYDLAKPYANLSGTMIPLYGLNSFVSHIPIVGDVLASRKGEGIISVTYKMKGSFENPNIEVNPLSALTPGIFRRIFED
ncbi:MAG: AsmA-like C-terminal domain-containing protein [Pseudomonadota bacterium]